MVEEQRGLERKALVSCVGALGRVFGGGGGRWGGVSVAEGGWAMWHTHLHTFEVTAESSITFSGVSVC